MADAINKLPPILPGIFLLPIANPFYGAGAVSIDGGGNFIGVEGDVGIILMSRGKDIGKYVSFKEGAGGAGTGASFGGEMTRYDYTGGNDNIRLKMLEGFRDKVYGGVNVYGCLGVGGSIAISQIEKYYIVGTTFSFSIGISPFLIDAGYNQGNVDF